MLLTQEQAIEVQNLKMGEGGCMTSNRDGYWVQTLMGRDREMILIRGQNQNIYSVAHQTLGMMRLVEMSPTDFDLYFKKYGRDKAYEEYVAAKMAGELD